jgi:hypothetical protein
MPGPFSVPIVCRAGDKPAEFPTKMDRLLLDKPAICRFYVQNEQEGCVKSWHRVGPGDEAVVDRFLAATRIGIFR